MTLKEIINYNKLTLILSKTTVCLHCAVHKTTIKCFDDYTNTPTKITVKYFSEDREVP